MERVTDPIQVRDYNEDHDIALRLFRQPGLGESDLSFSVYDADNNVPIIRAKKNVFLFGDAKTVSGDKYIYARIGAAQEPFIRYSISSGKWEIYPAPSGGPGSEPILAAHKILQADVHTDTENGTPVQGDLIIANDVPKWNRFPKGSANQILGVQPSGITLEWKNIVSLLNAGAGIAISGSTIATISNTGVLAINAMAGAISIVGTTNQVIVSSGGGTVTLSLPQNIHTGAVPTFAGLALTSLTGVLFGNGSSPLTALAATGALQYLRRNAANNAYEFATISAADVPHNLLSAPHPDTVAAAPVLGDIIAANSTPRWQRVPGNTSTTKRFLTQTGTGSASALPVWDTIAVADLPPHASRHQSGGNDQINVSGLLGLLAEAQKVSASKNGTLVGTRQNLNFIEGSNITITMSDDPGNQRVNITLAATITAAPIDAAYVTVSSNPTLTAERVLVGTANQIIVTDGGPNGNVTLSTPQNIHTGAAPTFAGLTLTSLTGVLFGNGSSPLTALAATGALQYLRRNAANNAYEFATISAADVPHNLLSAPHPDTVAAAPVLGDIIAANSTPRWQRVPGNTSTTKRFLTQTGTGSASALPVWDTIAVADLPPHASLHQSGGNDQINVSGLLGLLAEAQKVSASKNGTLVGTRQNLNFIEGSNITITMSDDPGNQRVNITLAATITAAPIDAAYVTVSSNPTLTAERVLVGTANQIIVTDGGPNGNITLSTPQNIHTGAAPTFAGVYINAADSSNKLLLNTAGTNRGRITTLSNGVHIQAYSASFSREDLFIKDDGTVGIGTVSPSQKLTVSGNVLITGQLMVGSTPVTLTDASGRIPGLTSTYFASLDASNLLATVTVRKNSVQVGSPRRQINFIESSGVQWSVSDTGSEIQCQAKLKRMLVLPIPGDPSAGAPVSVRIAAPTGGTITAVRHICTVAAQTTYTYDINKNQQTIYTSQGDRPTRTSGHGVSLVTAAQPNVTSFNTGDVFEVDLDVKGSNVKDVVFFIEYVES